MAQRRRRGGTDDEDLGGYIVLGGQKVPVKKHETDFSVMAPADALPQEEGLRIRALAPRYSRVSAPDAAERDAAMREVREREVAHHIYEVADTGEEILIADRVILELRHEGTGELERIMNEYHLVYVTRMGNAHVLRLTNDTQRNPVKLANELMQRPEVAACTPDLMQQLQFHAVPELFAQQWYLTTDLTSDPEVVPNADIDAIEAWAITTGRAEIVVAVIDDGFDLGHPALAGVRLHPDARDFQDQDGRPLPDVDDYHGTPVASIAVGAHHADSAMRGVAPGCTFLPVRIGFGPTASSVDMLEVFRFVAARADVVNCSFGLPPTSFDPLPRPFRDALTELTRTGGRRGKGLVMVFSAANDDAPTFLEGARNVNGVRFVSGATIRQIPAGRTVYSGYPLTEGLVVVAAMSSRKRKAGYSSWGPHITVAAPSNNLHYIPAFTPPGTPGRAEFVASYRGRGQVAASNRPGHGSPFQPIRRFDDPSTVLREDLYTREFGGTSGAAPVVTGVVALMLSVNPQLTADEVRNILMATADQDLDPMLDLANDPNTQGLSGAFVAGRSLWFGAGKVDAARAVARARALPGALEPMPSGDIVAEAAPGLAIPDRTPQGVVSHLDIDRDGRLTAIEVAVEIRHTWRGDLRVALVAPGGFVALLHDRTGGGAQDLARAYTAADTPDLDALVRGGIAVRGRWTLHIADLVARDVGTLTRWTLRLRVG
jgi:subtilisin-like proprotein convertase family protein